jgi:hypothetical protein|mmetsp:Transcript_56544/g.89798  ORF Transcript_56544/g.89798 Transcript_56544/m.89798 type:complete len:444 (+) Transcript_56544:106-1437(+)
MSRYVACLTLFSSVRFFLVGASAHLEEAVLRPDGGMVGSGHQRRVMRRHDGESAAGEIFEEKVKIGLASKTRQAHTRVASAPAVGWPSKWLGENLETLQTNCAIHVDDSLGISDYGKAGHSCAACTQACTDGNKQKPFGTSFTFTPPLTKQAPAKAAHFYTILESVNGLGCSHCVEWRNKTGTPTALQHSYEIEFSTNGDSTFKANMGSYLEGGAGASSFPGKLFFVVKDIVPPDDNPANRRMALLSAEKNGELFTCSRFCSSEAGCPSGSTDALGCALHAHIGTGMMIRFAIRETADEALVPMVGADNVQHTLGGQQWEAVATFGLDNSTERIEAVIGRVILEGSSVNEGIISMKQTLEHKGCVPCDMFYSSVVSIGPFVTTPSDVHWVSSSDFLPPEGGADSCELYRVTADGGHVLRLESGPGLVAATQDRATLYTCPNPS